MRDNQFQKLLDDTVKAARRHNSLTNQCRDEILRRHGINYNDLDCDHIIDCLEYGHGGRITIEQVQADVEFAKETLTQMN